MISNRVLINLIGHYAILFIKNENMKRPKCYRGKVMSISEGKLYIDEIICGETPFNINDIQEIRRLSRLDLQKLMLRFESAGWKLRLAQADERIQGNIEALRKKLKGG